MFIAEKVPFEHWTTWKMTWNHWHNEEKTICNARIWWCILWIDSKDLNDSWKWINSMTRWIPNCLKWKYKHVPCSRVDYEIQSIQMKYVPHHNGWVPLLFLTRLKRVTNTQYSSSSDESNLICFMNLRKEWFIPKRGSLIVWF